MTIDEKRREVLFASGKLATVARRIVGGMDYNGFNYAPANVVNIGTFVEQLRIILEDYDQKTIELHEMAK